MRLAWFWTRLSARRASTIGVIVLACAALRACFIEIRGPLALDPDAGGGNAGSAGTEAGDAGSSATDGGCAVGQLSCAGECIPCSAGPRARVGCDADAGKCIVMECEPDFVDCDGVAANGCEVEFGPFAGDLETRPFNGGDIYRVPHLSQKPSVALGGRLVGWEKATSIPLIASCADCASGTRPGGFGGEPILNPAEVPPERDLQAYFRVGWFAPGLFVLALAKDNQVYGQPSGPDAGASAQLQDSLEIFVDSLSDPSPNYGIQDHHIFVGVDSDEFDPQHPPNTPGRTAPDVVRITHGSCFFIQAELRSGSLNPTPNAGVQYGFSVGVNDWDSEDQPAPAREHQVIWKSPGPEYGFVTVLFPRIELMP